MSITIETVRLFGSLTGGRFDVWALAGDSRRFDRVRLMAAIQGVPKLPQAKCGVFAIQTELVKRLDAAGDCQAARDTSLREKCRAMVG